MTHSNDNTLRRKGKHSSYSERAQIAILKTENYSNRQIATALGRVPQTISNEIHRGTITQLKRQKQKGKVYKYYTTSYDPDAGQAAYDRHRLNSGAGQNGPIRTRSLSGQMINYYRKSDLLTWLSGLR